MKRVERSEILDYETYDEQRAAIREEAMRAKALRRVHVGAELTFLFENPTTVRYQVLEMVRAERIVKEADIEHELATYNELLGQEGDLGATLLIEIENPRERDGKLRAWLDLPERCYLKLDDGTTVYASFDERQKGDDRLSSVQFLRFAVGGRAPVAVGVDLAGLRHEVVFAPETRRALATDLGVV